MITVGNPDMFFIRMNFSIYTHKLSMMCLKLEQLCTTTVASTHVSGQNRNMLSELTE